MMKQEVKEVGSLVKNGRKSASCFQSPYCVYKQERSPDEPAMQLSRL